MEQMHDELEELRRRVRQLETPEIITTPGDAGRLKRQREKQEKWSLQMKKENEEEEKLKNIPEEDKDHMYCPKELDYSAQIAREESAEEIYKLVALLKTKAHFVQHPDLVKDLWDKEEREKQDKLIRDLIFKHNL
jgi:hypothetical protein